MARLVDGEAEALEQQLWALAGSAGKLAEPAPDRQEESLRAFVARDAMALAAAVANAVYDAIGIRFHELPATPEVVWKAINSRQGNSKQ